MIFFLCAPGQFPILKQQAVKHRLILREGGVRAIWKGICSQTAREMARDLVIANKLLYQLIQNTVYKYFALWGTVYF